jgi:hypothetical protein
MKFSGETLRKDFVYNSRPRYSQKPGDAALRYGFEGHCQHGAVGTLRRRCHCKIRTTSAIGPDSVSFDTSTEGLKALKAANVPDSVIKSYD